MVFLQASSLPSSAITVAETAAAVAAMAMTPRTSPAMPWRAEVLVNARIVNVRRRPDENIPDLFAVMDVVGIGVGVRTYIVVDNK